jgi:hypothetical protein
MTSENREEKGFAAAVRKGGLRGNRKLARNGGFEREGVWRGERRLCYRMLMLRSPLLLSCALLAAFARAPAMPAVESFPLKTFQKRRVSSAAAQSTRKQSVQRATMIADLFGCSRNFDCRCSFLKGIDLLPEAQGSSTLEAVS